MPTDPAPGLAVLPSAHNAEETVRRLEAVLAAKGVRLFAKIDHAAGARDAGLSLRPTVLLLFGSPASGTPLMQSNQAIGIDLPLKALVWEDEAGAAWVGYNRPTYLAERHRIQGRDDTLKAMTAALDALARAGTAP